MRLAILEYVLAHPGCTVDDLMREFQGRSRPEIEDHVITADEHNLLNANITRQQTLEGEIINIGYLHATNVTAGYVERARPRWRR